MVLRWFCWVTSHELTKIIKWHHICICCDSMEWMILYEMIISTDPDPDFPYIHLPYLWTVLDFEKPLL